MTSELEGVRVVFIGGTGRCGTNILKDILSRHSQVASLPFEHRLFIDPDGLIDLYCSYSQAWSPFFADKRIERLERFLEDMTRVRPLQALIRKCARLLHPQEKLLSPARYCGWELRRHFPNFEKHNDELLSKIRAFSYEAVWPGTTSYTYRPRIRHGEHLTKEALGDIVRIYVRSLLGDFLTAKGKAVFVEDNTWNILFAREFVELLPECKIVNIYRDPRDVVASFSLQRWCPSDKTEAALFYRSIMRYWIEQVRENVPSESLFEIRLETLVSSTERVLKQLCKFVGLPFERCLLDVNLSRAHTGRWRKEFSAEEKTAVLRILGDMVSELGYR